MKNNPHIGSSFDSFLEEEGLLEEVTASAQKKGLGMANRPSPKETRAFQS